MIVDFPCLGTLGVLLKISSQVGVQTKIKFEFWKSELIMNFVILQVQKMHTKRLLKFLILFYENWKSILKMSQKHNFCEFQQKMRPSIFHFFIFGCTFSGPDGLKTSYFAWCYHLTLWTFVTSFKSIALVVVEMS